MATATRRRSTSKRSETAPRALTQIAGYAADEPEIRQYEGDEFTTFRVGTNRYYDDDNDESTRWYGVAVNKPAVQDWVQAHISKGTAVVVEGTVTKKEGKEGEVYFNMTGFRVGLVDWFIAGDDGSSAYDPDEDL